MTKVSKKIVSKRKIIPTYPIIAGAGIKDWIDDLRFNIGSKWFDIKSNLRRNKTLSNLAYSTGRALNSDTIKRGAEIIDHFGYGSNKTKKRKTKK